MNYSLQMKNERLELIDQDNPDMTPVVIDFVSGKTAYRRKYGHAGGEAKHSLELLSGLIAVLATGRDPGEIRARPNQTQQGPSGRRRAGLLHGAHRRGR